MKRINLSVNLDDNELLIESIKQALAGQARQIARESLQEELKEEIERITNARIEEVKQSSYWNIVATRISEIIVKRFGDELTVNTKEINDMLESKVSEYLDKKLSRFGGIENMIQTYIDKSIANALLNKGK